MRDDTGSGTDSSKAVSFDQALNNDKTAAWCGRDSMYCERRSHEHHGRPGVARFPGGQALIAPGRPSP
jgi:hypothetical protein